MNKITEKKQVSIFLYFCAIVYFTSYISRINLGAVLVDMTQTGFSSKEIISGALTASFVTYGIGQLISGWLGDRFKPQNLILTGFIITSFVNISVSSLQSPALIIPLWALNGFAHSLMWPPLVKIMTTALTKDDYNNRCVIVSYGSSIGTIAVYLFSPLLIELINFRAVFIISGSFALIMAILVKYMFERKYKFEYVSVKETKKNIIAGKLSPIMLVLLVIVMLVIVLQGSLRDGVQTWMPTYISETFKLGSSVSILTGVILPLFSLLCHLGASKLNEKVFKNEFVCLGVIFSVGFISAFLLAEFSDYSVILSTLLSAMLTGSMNGTNFILTCILPPYFAKKGNISFISGLLNSCTYVGSAVSIYGFAIFSKKFAWNGTIWLWASIALTATIICYAFAKAWQKSK